MYGGGQTVSALEGRGGTWQGGRGKELERYMGRQKIQEMAGVGYWACKKGQCKRGQCTVEHTMSTRILPQHLSAGEIYPSVNLSMLHSCIPQRENILYEKILV